jgi:hypothetical protein
VKLIRERSVLIAIGMWIVCSAAVYPLSGGTLPFNRPAVGTASVAIQLINPLITLAALLALMLLIYGLTKRRAIPDMIARAPNLAVARTETIALWIYGGAVMIFGRVLGQKLFGEGIGLHLNGSLFGATRVQSPHEVWTWAIFNFVLFALVPYLVFRARGYSREALNLKSTNIRNDALVIFVVLGILCAVDLLGPNLLRFPAHQIPAGAAISFVAHLLGTGLPVMIFIYAILMPRYMRLTDSTTTSVLLGGASYATLHLFEYWTVYDTVRHGILSVIFVYLTFVPPGLVKSFLTLRTGNAWVHLWGFHAISPHVTADTGLIIRDFGIR